MDRDSANLYGPRRGVGTCAGCAYSAIAAGIKPSAWRRPIILGRRLEKESINKN